MSNKTAVVTGASRGIGKAVALYFARKGYDLVLVSKNEETLSSLAKDIAEKNANIQVSYFPFDLSTPEMAQACVEKVFKEISSLDVLFNGAGIAIGKTAELSVEDMVLQMNTNYIATFAFSTTAARLMKSQRCGYIFTMSSIVAKKAIPANGGYCASKSAVLGFSQALFYELLDYSVKVTALCPGAVDTDMTNKVALSSDEKIQTDDIVHTISYLLSLSPSAAIDSIDIRCVKRPL